jgi:hypothetical protein
MRRSQLAIVALLASAALTSSSAQSITDRLKGAIKVNGKSLSESDSIKRADSTRKADSLKRAAARPAATPTTPTTSALLPTSSKAHPDLNGVLIGQSTTHDVVALLAQTPTLVAGKPHMGVLASHPDVHAKPTPIPKTQYVAGVRVATKAYLGRTSPVPSGDGGTEEIIRAMRDDYFCGGGADEKRGNCEDWTLNFAPYPADPVVLGMEREVTTAPSPLGSNVAKSLVTKYGEPTYKNSDTNKPVLTWIFKDDGSVMRKERAGNCSYPMNDALRYLGSPGGFDIAHDADELLKNGCVAVLTVIIDAPNDVAKRVTYRAFDAFAWWAAQNKSNKVISDFETQQREAAAKVKPPIQ